MKLCMPTLGNHGMESELSGHFGSAPWFMLYDPAKGSVEAVANSKAGHEHGQCRPMDLLAGHEIAAVLCKGMGRNAVHAVERQGIKVFMTGGSVVRDAVDEFAAGRLIKLDAETGCAGHDCH